jgi:hypothetical protein
MTSRPVVYAIIALFGSLPFSLSLYSRAQSVNQLDSVIVKQCKDARDFQGCVNAFTTPADASSNSLTALRSAMKQVASRLSSGTSLRDSSSVFQPVIDAHAVVPADQQKTLAYQAASLAISLFNDAQAIWQARISNASYSTYTGRYQTAAACNYYQGMVRAAAIKTGNPSAFSWGFSKKGLLGVTCSSGTTPESPVYRYVIGVLQNGSIDPSEIADYTQKYNEAKRLAALGPWQRYLDQNPGMAQWVKANPGLAEKKKAEYLEKHGSDPVPMPPLPSSMQYLKGTIVEKFL